jgi:hypothetical protein
MKLCHNQQPNHVLSIETGFGITQIYLFKTKKMIMKTRIVLILFFFGALMTACQKDTLNPLATTELDEMIALSAARYSAEADPTTKDKCKGKLTELATADLPAAVTSYISANYAGAELKFAGKDQAGNVVVGLKLADGTPKGLLFDNTGTFKQELSRYKKHAKLTRVDVAALPASITAYVAANFAGAAIKHAGTNGAGQFFVMVVVGDKPSVLVFEADGSFKGKIDKPMKRDMKFGPGHK